VLSVLSTAPRPGGSELSDVTDRINWKEAGVSKADFWRWWRDHQARDAQRAFCGEACRKGHRRLYWKILKGLETL